MLYRKGKGEIEPRIIPEEAEVVRNIFKMYDEGHSLDQIKTYLESKCIKTPTGKDVWSKENIRKMLTNEKYVGDVIHQKPIVQTASASTQKLTAASAQNTL